MMVTTPQYVTTTPARRRSSAFTIIELMVSVAIISVIMLIVFPVIGSLQNGSRIEAGLNTVSMASDVARAWATASLPQANASDDPVNPVVGASYSGTAVIFCPTGEARIVINDQYASDSGAFLEEAFPAVNGYKDYRLTNRGKRDLDYIAMPDGTGVAGIYRNDSGAHLIAPPFAVAYDRDGMMIPGANIGSGARVIYYDSNFDGDYDTSQVRSSVAGYNPNDWDRASAPRDDTGPNATLSHHLPFEAIETVVGVIIYDQRDAEAAGYDFSGGGVYSQTDPANTGYDWLRENGTAVFFSPNTGVAMRDEGNE